MPYSATILLACDDWHCKPWDITGETLTDATRIYWFVYWQTYRVKKIRAMVKAKNG